MGRYGIALAAGMILLAGCSGQRVLETNDAVGPTVAQADVNPFVVEFAQPLQVTPVRDEIGMPPVPAGERLALSDDAPSAPDVPAEASELTPDDSDGATTVDSDPCVAFPDPCAVRAARSAPCGSAKGSCCGQCGNDCGCKQKCPCPDPCGNPCGGYVGGTVAVGPGIGGGMEFGINFKRTKNVLWSFEFGLTYQDLTDSLNSGDNWRAGKMAFGRVGVRARFRPCCKGHPTLRVGLGWLNVSGDGSDPSQLDLAEIDGGVGDYFGGYVGVGYEYDLNARWSTGPEVSIFGGFDADGDTAVVPTLAWHFNYRF